MRRNVATFAVCTLLSCPAVVLSQQQPDRAPSRQQVIYKEWAKGIRESVESAKKMKNKKEAQRDAWMMKSAKSKEDKLRARYHLSPRQLSVINMNGLQEKWPTEKPEDLAVIRPILDPVIFEEELDTWMEAHARPIPSVEGERFSPQEFSARMRENTDRAAEVRRKAPVTVCAAALRDGKKCPRKVVGRPGRLCYEHRPSPRASN
jgi:hypothetical protein